MTLKSKIDPRITEIVARLQNAGYETYIVGGAVRDFLLERTPKDYDLSTAATPEQIRSVFRDKRTLIIGRRFRLVHLFLGDDIIEISTFRKPPNAEDQADRPPRAANAPEHMIFQDNEFGTSEDDAQRRDFTCNALFYDPVNNQIADFTKSGLDDIKAGIVRCIGKPALRFEEDPVRILRALKLVGQYGFTLEAETEKALHEVMPMIVHASISRMTLELEKILKNPYGDQILAAFRKYGFLQYFLPALDRRFDTEQGQYAMALLAKRNERLRAGCYRDSMSLAIALLTLPFFEKSPNGSGIQGGLWTPRSGIEPLIADLIRAMFKPMALTRRACAAAVRNFLPQVRLKAGERLPRRVQAAGFATAREMSIIQNEVQWHIDDFETRIPQSFRTGGKPGKRKKKHRKDRKDWKRSMEPSNVTESQNTDIPVDATPLGF